MSEIHEIPAPELPPDAPKAVLPIRDRILVKRKSIESHKGLIEIPEQYRDLPNEGTVMAIGDGRMLSNGTIIPIAVAVGDHVLFGRFVGTEILLNGEELLMLREDDVVAAIRTMTPEYEVRTALRFTSDSLKTEEEKGEAEDTSFEEEEVDDAQVGAEGEEP
jgi:chaperonin GroES